MSRRVSRLPGDSPGSHMSQALKERVTRRGAGPYRWRLAPAGRWGAEVTIVPAIPNQRRRVRRIRLAQSLSARAASPRRAFPNLPCRRFFSSVDFLDQAQKASVMHASRVLKIAVSNIVSLAPLDSSGRGRSRGCAGAGGLASAAPPLNGDAMAGRRLSCGCSRGT